jgi:uncharacterized protein (TIGR03546 family)
MLKVIAKVLKVLNSETDPGQISLAFCLSMIAGLTPLFSLHNFLIFFLVLILRVNLSAFLLGTVFFSGVAYLLDPFFHWIGLTALTTVPLEGLWTALYNCTLCRLERFNNSVVMGSLLFSLVIFVPMYILGNLVIRRYREHVLSWIQKVGIVRALKASKFYELYQSVSGWGGAR